MKTSPTQRSTKYLRSFGYIVCKVEQRLPIPGMFVTRDAFGFGDLLAAGKGMGIALVQSTSRVNLSARIAKAKALPEFQKWIDAGGIVIFHGWSKKGKKGKRKLWHVEEQVEP